MSIKNPSILMVTGVYYPEINGAVQQCQRVIKELEDSISFSILSSTRNEGLISPARVDNTIVYRVFIRGNGVLSNLNQLIDFVKIYITKFSKFDIIHFHGFSRRSFILIILAKLFRQQVIIKMTSFGHDDPMTIKRKYRYFYFLYRIANAYIGISKAFEISYRQSKLDVRKFYLIPNGVDTLRFSPKTSAEVIAKREQLGLPKNMVLILCIGHFSKEKASDHLIKAWEMLPENLKVSSSLVFIGSTEEKNFEVDFHAVEYLKKKMAALNKHIIHIEKTNQIENYYTACDMFVLPSLREGLPNVLLEAMSCEKPVISTKLPGITDWVINGKIDGFLYQPGCIAQLSRSLEVLLKDPVKCQELGSNARKKIIKKFDIINTTLKIKALYGAAF